MASADNYTWQGGTSTWSNDLNWTDATNSGNSGNDNPGDGGSSTTDTATLSNQSSGTTTITYDTNASGYVGTLAMVQTTNNVKTYLVLNQALTLNQGGQEYIDTGKGLEQIDLEGNNLTIASGATFTLGSTTDSSLDGSNAQTYITNQAVAASGATAGSGGVVVNGMLQIAADASFAPQIIAPVTLSGTGTLNLNEPSGSEDRLYINGNFSSTSGSVIEATGTNKADAQIFFEGSTVTIGSGTTISWFNSAAGALQFTNAGGQNISLATIFATNANYTIAAGTAGTYGAQSVTTSTLTSTATSGATSNAINQMGLTDSGATYSTFILKLGSNLNLVNSGPAFAISSGLASSKTGNDITIDLAGFSYTLPAAVTNNPGFTLSATTAAGITQMNITNSSTTSLGGGGTTISGTQGAFVFQDFVLSSNDIGIGSGVILQAYGTGLLNNLSTNNSNATASAADPYIASTINSGSAFYYTGGSAAASALTSNRTIGSLIVGTAAGSSSTLELSSNITAAGPATINTGSTLNLTDPTGSLVGTAGTYALTAGGLSGSGTITNNATGATATTLTSNGSGTTTFSGKIADAGSTNTLTLAIGGTGTQTISGGTNTYGGGTSVNAGTLMVTNGSGTSALGTGALTVAPGGTIGGSGNASGLASVGIGSGSTTKAQVIVGTGGTDSSSGLTLGTAGAATITNANLTYNLSSTVAQQSNLLTVNTGSALAFSTTASTVTLNLVGAGYIAYGTSFELMSDSAGFGGSLLTTSGNVITGGLSIGTSADFTANGTYAGGLYSGSYLYLTNGGTQIDVDVVPEPGTWALMLGGLGLLLFWQRQRACGSRR